MFATYVHTDAGDDGEPIPRATFLYGDGYKYGPLDIRVEGRGFTAPALQSHASPAVDRSTLLSHRLTCKQSLGN